MSKDFSDFTLAGYTKIKLVGKGARSEIWQVKHQGTNQMLALKRTMINNKSDTRYLDQTYNEHHTLQHVKHPNIRKTYAIREIRSLFTVKEIQLLMEYCKGDSLKDRPPFGLLRICDIFTQVASIMHHVNSAGFIHADMKPGNILASETGKISIIDFGQSCRVGTIKERIQGTPEFIAPEQIHRKKLDVRTDVYNFGASLYWGITKKKPPPPMVYDNPLQASNKTAIEPPSKINPKVPQSLDDLTLQCMELEPGNRPHSMLVVARRLGQIMYQDLNLHP